MSLLLLATIPKLNGTNYASWKDHVTAFLYTQDLGSILEPAPAFVGATASSTATGADKGPNPAESMFSGLSKTAQAQSDAKAYGFIFFLVEDACRGPLNALATKSGRQAWEILRKEYEKDSPSMCMSLRQKFYSILHDSSTSVNTFIEAVLSITRQLRAINHAPLDEEIMDKILVSLDPTFASIRAVLCLRTPAPSLSEVQNTLIEFETQLGSAATAKAGGYEVLYASRSSSKANDKGDFDWTNTQRKDSVCWRCGRAKHTAQYCVADMPEDIKRKVLSRSCDQHTNIATPSPPVHDPITNDPSALFMLRTDVFVDKDGYATYHDPPAAALTVVEPDHGRSHSRSQEREGRRGSSCRSHSQECSSNHSW